MTEVDSASSKSVRMHEIRFTQNFIFTFSDDYPHHRLAFTGDASPTAGRRYLPRAHGGCHGKPTKGAASCDKFGRRKRPSIRGFPNGEPSRVMPCYPHPNEIRCEEATGGTETSKYPEKEINRDSGSSGERNGYLNRARASDRALLRGVAGATSRGLLSRAGYKARGSGTAHGRPAAAGEPVRDPLGLRRVPGKGRGGHETRSEAGGPPSKAEHSPMTDSEPVP